MSEETKVNILGFYVPIERYDSDEVYPWTLARAELVYGQFDITIFRNRYNKKIQWHVGFRGGIYLTNCPTGECDTFTEAAEAVNRSVKLIVLEINEIETWAKS
jgi:hypothetical protein